MKGLQEAPLQLKRAFIGLSLAKEDFQKIKGILLLPSYKQELSSMNGAVIINLVYEIEHDLKTAKQYQWLSDIKIKWKRNIIISYEYISEFFINEYTENTGAKYSLLELGNAFQDEFIEYPKPMYALNKKDLYQKLTWYATRLNEKGLLTLEILYAAAMRMNGKFEVKYQNKELYKKAYQAYTFISDNHEMKSKKEVMLIRKQNGINRGKQKELERLDNFKRIKELIPLHIKPNGATNVSSIARELGLRRETVSRALKLIASVLLVVWLKSSLVSIQGLDGYTIIRSAKVTLFTSSLFKGFKRCLQCTKELNV